MNTLICTAVSPCWMPGLGFRWLKDTGRACAIDDAPLPKFAMIGDCDPLRFVSDCAAPAAIDPAGAQVAGVVAEVAAVPLPGPLGLMIGAICILAIVAIFKNCHALETIR